MTSMPEKAMGFFKVQRVENLRMHHSKLVKKEKLCTELIDFGNIQCYTEHRMTFILSNSPFDIWSCKEMTVTQSV